MKKLVAGIVALLMALGIAAPAQAQSVGWIPDRTAATIIVDGGGQVGTPNAGQRLPALSLAKLYLGYWVLYHGSDADKAQVYEMIRVSHDGIASNLDRRYPQAIPEIIRDFGLTGSSYNGYWGNAGTSANDVARFVAEIRNDPVARPIIDGMRNAAPVAADGYPQNFGTATLPGARGTKFGWADDASMHATVTLGDGWVAAAITRGSAADITNDVGSLTPGGAPAPAGPGPVTTGDVIDTLVCLDPVGSSRAVAGNLPRDIVVPDEVAGLIPSC